MVKTQVLRAREHIRDLQLTEPKVAKEALKGFEKGLAFGPVSDTDAYLTRLIAKAREREGGRGGG